MIDWKRVIICFLIFVFLATPIFLMTIVNMFQLPSIKIGPITIQNFKYFSRTSDMLIFSDNKLKTFVSNLGTFLKVVILQKDGLIWNSFDNIGTLYLFSFPIIIYGCWSIVKKDSKENKDNINKFGKVILIAWLIIGVLCGLLINSVNINRINIIWYVLLIFNGIGIYKLLQTFKKSKKTLTIFTILLYGVSFCYFINYFYSIGVDKISKSSTWSYGLVDAVSYANQQEQKTIVLSPLVCMEDKQDVFIKYGTEFQLLNKVTVDDFMRYNYYEKNSRPSDYYNTVNKEYKIDGEYFNFVLEEECYVLTKAEYAMAFGTEKYKADEFGNYVVLTKTSK